VGECGHGFTIAHSPSTVNESRMPPCCPYPGKTAGYSQVRSLRHAVRPSPDERVGRHSGRSREGQSDIKAIAVVTTVWVGAAQTRRVGDADSLANNRDDVCPREGPRSPVGFDCSA